MEGRPVDKTKDDAGKGGWTRELLASVVVFLVALPLCMGIALASGVPPAYGLLSGIIGGLVVGLIAGSPLQVSGPAAGLAVVVWELVTKHGLTKLGIIIMIAGTVQIIAGALRLGQWFRAVSPAVIQGMLAGIGVLIFASQFHVMVDDKPRGSGLMNIASIPESILKAVAPEEGKSHHVAALVGVATILTLVLWQIFQPKKLKFIPGPLLGVLVAVGLSAAFGLPIKHVDIPDNLFGSIDPVSPRDFLDNFDTALLGSGAAVAFIASAETLLCAAAVDQMHDGARTKYDRELSAQGVGNLLCGIVGALPLTGVIVRSAANVEAGAKTRLSAIMHGVWMLGLVALLPHILERIPTSSLAAVLVFTGYKLVNPKAIKKIASHGRSELGIYAATLLTIVVKDLLTGVIVGLVLSVLKLVWTRSKLIIDVEQVKGEEKIIVHLAGAATFVRLPLLAAALESLPPKKQIVIRASALDYVDSAALDLIENFERQRSGKGQTIEVDWKSIMARFRRRPQESAPSSVEATPVEGAG